MFFQYHLTWVVLHKGPSDGLLWSPHAVNCIRLCFWHYLLQVGSCFWIWCWMLVEPVMDRCHAIAARTNSIGRSLLTWHIHRMSIEIDHHLHLIKHILRLVSYYNKTITSHTTNIFTLTFRSLAETFMKRSSFSSSGSCHDRDVTWQRPKLRGKNVGFVWSNSFIILHLHFSAPWPCSPMVKPLGQYVQ